MKTIAIVVTYNRKELLLECIQSLENQTSSSSLSIMIIDNASTDGTYEALLPLIENERIIYRNTGANLGGAGGFEYGVLQAIMEDYDYVWILDDDTIPTKTALEKFYDFADGRQFGFLSSYVKWTDGSTCTMNVQRKNIFNKLSSFKKEVIPIQYATFVSMFVSMDIIREVGAPIGEFFIWGDDWEYTRRLSKRYKSYLIRNSVVIHKTLHNQGCNISNDVEERIPRYKLYYRNNYYIAKKDGISGYIYYGLKILKDLVLVLVKSKSFKAERMEAILTGIKDGIKFNPKVKYK